MVLVITSCFGFKNLIPSPPPWLNLTLTDLGRHGAAYVIHFLLRRFIWHVTGLINFRTLLWLQGSESVRMLIYLPRCIQCTEKVKHFQTLWLCNKCIYMYSTFTYRVLCNARKRTQDTYREREGACPGVSGFALRAPSRVDMCALQIFCIIIIIIHFGINFWRKFPPHFLLPSPEQKLHPLTLLLLVPFSYKLMHHLEPFAIVVLNGEITVYSVDSPNGFEWYSRSANTKPCLDLSKR